MNDLHLPDPNIVHPIPGYDAEVYVRPTLSNPNISVGEFTYIADSEFESHVTHFYPWSRDKLIIGKFCQIAAGVEFMMNDANHPMNAVTTYPFYTLPDWGAETPPTGGFRYKGDTVVGNDVWIGEHALILPGVQIGDGAIIGSRSVVASDVAPYSIVAGNPAGLIRKRFDSELTELLLAFRWWDRPLVEIRRYIPLLTTPDLGSVKAELKKLL